ncbi:MAG: hypothetical protein K2M83_07760 [Muribaculaceae bacterium]|nr:hypothetical protein [Muribaculaceae bacterium]
MSILDFFKKKNKTSNNNADEVFISSDKPYIVAEGCTDDLQSFRTYTERLKFQGLLKLELSCKVFYEEENGWVIEFFLPAPDIIEKVQEIRRNPKPCMFSVWIWFEDGTFDINFPSCCDLDVYAKEGIIWCPITLSETGFDSEEKKLKEKYPTKEDIERFMLEKISKHRIVEIEPKLVMESEDFDGEPILIENDTTKIFKKAFDAINSYFFAIN